MSINVSDPVTAPSTEGVNATEIEQVVPPASGVVQVFVSEKSPVAAMLAAFSGALPVLVSVNVCVALVPRLA